jgi:hypothetical protein
MCVCVLVLTVFCIVCTVFYTVSLMCLLLFVLSVRVKELLPPSDNSIAVNNNNNNNNNNSLVIIFSTAYKLQSSLQLCAFFNLSPSDGQMCPITPNVELHCLEFERNIWIRERKISI